MFRPESWPYAILIFRAPSCCWTSLASTGLSGPNNLVPKSFGSQGPKPKTRVFRSVWSESGLLRSTLSGPGFIWSPRSWPRLLPSTRSESGLIRSTRSEPNFYLSTRSENGLTQSTLSEHAKFWSTKSEHNTTTLTRATLLHPHGTRTSDLSI